MAAVAAASFAASAHAAVTPITWCGGTATATDRPDTFGGDQLHVIYATPSDSADRFVQVSSSIATDIDAIDAWWRKQDPTRAPRWDIGTAPPCTGFRALDISDVKLPHPASFYNQSAANRLTLLRADLTAAGFTDPAKKYLVYYDQAVSAAGSECGSAFVNAQEGGTHGYAAVYIAPNLESTVPGRGCGSIESNGIRGGYLAVVAAHEIVNELGALDNTSSPGPPHKCPSDSLHPCDNSLDVLTPTPTATSLDSAILDFNHDDYYAHSGTWWDVQDSAWLRHLNEPEYRVRVDLSKGGSLVDTAQPSLACAAGTTCKWTWAGGSSLTLVATPEAGYHFVGWRGCPSVQDLTCTVTVDKSLQIGARFVPPLRITGFHVKLRKKPFRLTATLHLSNAGEVDLVGCSFGAQPVANSSIKGMVASCTWDVPARFRGHRVRGAVELNVNGRTVLAKVFHVRVPRS